MNPNFGSFLAAAPDHYRVLGWIVLLPLIGAVINGLLGRRIGRDGVYIVGVTTVAASFLLSLLAFFALVKATASHAAEGGTHAPAQLSYLAWEWFRAPTGGGGAAQLKFRYVLDALSGVMLLVVTGVGTLIHLYSTGYMSHDKGYARFFSFLNLFMFSMLNLILGDSIVLLFVGWEGVGLCSYLLIGFWFTNSQYASAGRKAFIVNRIGDVGVILGITIIAWKLGAYEFSSMREAVETTGSNTFGEFARKAELNHFVSHTLSAGRVALQQRIYNLIPDFTWGGLACFLLFFGCTGKSAQIPLYVWLPDAMAGPTPVSALIHAATMVTAGVYLLCRMSFMFVHFPTVMAVVAVIGALTALLAATIAIAQNELKKVLAYSTVSQLGYMFLGCGVGAFGAGLFHVYTHAMFKACLFLGAGAVMHACRDKQDLRELGGLKKYIPITYATFLIATLAIIGTPGFSGFFSKDEILFRALTSHNASHPWVGKFVYVVGLITAALTAFYMCRLLFMTFFGEFKGWSLTPGVVGPGRADLSHDAAGRPDHPHTEPEPVNEPSPDEAAKAAHDTPANHVVDEHDHEEHVEQGNPWDPPRENPWNMTAPLVILAALSIVAGYVGLPYAFTHAESPWAKWLHRVVREPHFDHHAHVSTEWLSMGFGTLAFLLGAGAAWWVYIAQKGAPAGRIAAMMPGLYRLVYDKWRVDELYNAIFVRPLRGVSTFAAAFFDRWIIDGLVRLVGLIPRAFGLALRYAQTGVVQVYGAFLALGVVAILAWVTLRPAASISYRIEGQQLILQANGGPGYRYAWDPEGDGTYQPEGTETRQTVRCTPTETPEGRRVCRVGLRARNAFGYWTTTVRTIELPSTEFEGRQ